MAYSNYRCNICIILHHEVFWLQQEVTRHKQSLNLPTLAILNDDLDHDDDTNSRFLFIKQFKFYFEIFGPSKFAMMQSANSLNALNHTSKSALNHSGVGYSKKVVKYWFLTLQSRLSIGRNHSWNWNRKYVKACTSKLLKIKIMIKLGLWRKS